MHGVDTHYGGSLLLKQNFPEETVEGEERKRNVGRKCFEQVRTFLVQLYVV
jgi:hypothetical protein